MKKNKHTPKCIVEILFKVSILPLIKQKYESNGVKNFSVRTIAWYNFTDSLCKNGNISKNHYNIWTLPDFCQKSK